MELNLKDINRLYLSDGSFGGDQAWFDDKDRFLIKRGCGIVAAANELIYLAFTRKEYRNLFPFNKLNKNTFKSFMEILKEYIKPSLLGIPTVDILDRGIENYSDFKNIKLNKEKIINQNKKEFIEFITKGLNFNSPILLVNWNHKNPILKFHWITITGIMKNKRIYIEFSSWGKKYKIEFNDSLTYSLYSGMIYYY